MSESKVIRRGTPTIDGKLDKEYLNSFCYVENPLEHVNYFPAGKEYTLEKMKNTAGKVYYLYDDEYLYICAVIHDDTICTRGKEWRMKEVWPWNDDGAEIYLWFSDADCFAIHSDAHGFRSVVDEHIWSKSHKSAGTYHDTPAEDWAASIDHEKNEYTIELRVKLPSYVGPGSKIGTILEIDDRFTLGWGQEKEVGAIFAGQGFEGTDQYFVTLEE